MNAPGFFLFTNSLRPAIYPLPGRPYAPFFMVAISLKDLSKRFGSAAGAASPPAVDSVSLQIPAGDLFFLLGPSGCGKTTLLRMIAGFVSPTSGRILFDQQDISAVPPFRRDTGMVFQSYALWPHMTVQENVAFGLDSRRVKGPERESRIQGALALVRMDSFADRRPNQLSGGQQQRVALARALVIRPKCLLLDEPLSNLDAQLRLEMRSEIRRIVKQSGATAIYVTHDQKEALSIADRIAIMRSGRLEQVGTPAELYRRPASRFVAGFVGESNFVSGTVETVSSTTALIKTPAGPILAAIPADPAPAWTRPAAGAPVCLAIRPESIGISSPASAPAGANLNRLPARRVSSSYLGEMAEHWLSVPGLDQPIKAFEMNPPSQNPHPGEQVMLTIPQDFVLLVSDDSRKPSS